MPYIIYLCHLYWIQKIKFDEYQDQLSLWGMGLNINPLVKEAHVTEPDLEKIKQIGGDI